MSTTMFRVMNLLVRTIAKPLISYVTHYKKIHLKEESTSKSKNYLRKKLINCGQNWNYYNVLINRKLFKISTGTTTIAELSEEKALERGAEIMGEVLVYTILLLVPLFEWIRLSKISKKKDLEKQKIIDDMRTQADLVIKDSEQIKNEIQEIVKLLEGLEKKL